MSKLHPTCPDKSFEAQFFFSKNWKFFECLVILREKILRLSNLNFTCSKGSFEESLVSEKKSFHFLLTLTKKFRPSGKLNSKELSKLHSNLAKDYSDEKYSFFRKNFLYKLSDIDLKLFNFLSKLLRRLVKTAFNLSKRYFSGTYLYEKILFFSCNFRKCAKICRHFVEKVR